MIGHGPNRTGIRYLPTGRGNGFGVQVRRAIPVRREVPVRRAIPVDDPPTRSPAAQANGRAIGAGGRRDAGRPERESWRENAAGAHRAASGLELRRGQELRLQVPWLSQFDGANVDRAGDKACYRACRAMGARAGVHVPENTTDRYQVAMAEDARGRVFTTPSRTAAARGYIDRELTQGRPVAVGLSLMDASYNRDRITDHFVLVTGKGVDRSGRPYYTYNEPLAQNAAQGRGGRLYVDPRNGNLSRLGEQPWDMSMVVRNQV